MDGQVTREDVIDAEAFCMGQDHFDRDGRRTMHMGRLDFHMEDFCAESISHEASHAAFRWVARRKGIAIVNIGTAGESGNDWVDDHEEDHATAVGVISSQIVEKAARFGLR